MNFTEELLSWYAQHARILPWREDTNPYHIWISEVILQQTRVNQGMSYYLRFVEKYPGVGELAAAEEEDVLKLWQGLGYYSRARNLLETARVIHRDYADLFPGRYVDLIRLKGIGEYTASAIASIAFGEAVPVLDGNVFRVLARVFGIEEPIDSTSGRKVFKALAAQHLSIRYPGMYNQAVMEFGALQCVPLNPDCETCVLRGMCKAKELNLQSRLPVKQYTGKVMEVYHTYLIPLMGAKTIMEKRNTGGLWRGLYQFPLIESIEKPDQLKIVEHTLWKHFAGQDSRLTFLPDIDIHLLSHRKIFANYILIYRSDEPILPDEHYFFIDQSELHKLPVSRLMERFLENNIRRFHG
ncbi:MAG: A/G-specific adenine glycosylase [Bacteroidales bacterium]|nr:A/G-specific adenine glycosylase [Bacteroidales bacterium]